MKNINLILVDDHDIFTRGLKLLLEEEEDIGVAAVAATGRELLELICTAPFDVLLVDVQLPDIEPEVLIREIRAVRPDAKLIYLTMMRGTRFIHRLMKNQIQGYILKNAPAKELVEAIRTVHNGGTWFSPEIDITHDDGEEVKQTIIVGENKIEQILSRREVEIVQWICKEYSNKEIAEKLFISVNTVDAHRKNIYLKLGVNNMAGVVKFALQHGLIK